MVTDDQLMALTLERSEELRAAIAAGDGAAAAHVLLRRDRRLGWTQERLVIATLIGELVEYVGELGLARVVIATDARATSLFAAFERDGRSGTFFQSVAEQFDVLSDDSQSEVLHALLAVAVKADEIIERISAAADEKRAELGTLTRTLDDGTTVRWIADRRLWVAANGDEFVVDPIAPEGFVPYPLWEAISQGQPLPGYVEPAPPSPRRGRPPSRAEQNAKPPRPDRTLAQKPDLADSRAYERAERMRTKARQLALDGKQAKAVRMSEKRAAFVLAHYHRTGRWLDLVPVRDGFWKDPTGRYAYRLWQGLNWTERVRDDAGREGIDPDFPTDADVKDWDRNNRRP